MSNNILFKGFNFFFSKFHCIPTVAFSPPNTIDHGEEQDHKPNNFNPLYDANSTAFSTSSATDTTDTNGGGGKTLPDFTSAFDSERFFFSSPGSSNSIFGEAPRPQPAKEYSGSGAVAVRRYSSDPYGEFRESMEEMIAARGFTEVGELDWDFLHELLLSYLTLNPSNAHDLIVRAFVDVIMSLVLPSDEDTCPGT